jgi:hypothetical protein
MYSFKNLIMAYAFYFLTQSFRYPLPWSSAALLSPDYFYGEVLNISASIEEVGEVQYGLFGCYALS